MAAYCRVDDTSGLTACTTGSAPGPTLGNKYGKPLPFTFSRWTRVCWFLLVIPPLFQEEIFGHKWHKLFYGPNFFLLPVWFKLTATEMESFVNGDNLIPLTITTTEKMKKKRERNEKINNCNLINIITFLLYNHRRRCMYAYTYTWAECEERGYCLHSDSSSALYQLLGRLQQAALSILCWVKEGYHYWNCNWNFENWNKTEKFILITQLKLKLKKTPTT